MFLFHTIHGLKLKGFFTFSHNWQPRESEWALRGQQAASSGNHDGVHKTEGICWSLVHFRSEMVLLLLNLLHQTQMSLSS